MIVTRCKDLGTGPESEMWNQYEIKGVKHLRFLLTGDANVGGTSIYHSRAQEDLPLYEKDFLSAFGSKHNFAFDSILLEPSNRAHF